MHGLGIFAEENIPKGKVIYIIEEGMDLHISPEKFNNLPNESKNTIKHYGYFDKINNAYHLSYDDIRFCNHSSTQANITNINGVLVAMREILSGEELLQNYSEFEDLRDDLK